MRAVCFLATQGRSSIVPGKIEGSVVAYSDDGNLVTDIPHDRLRTVPSPSGVSVVCDEHETVGIFPPDHKEPNFTFLALLGPSGFLELAIVGDSAKAMLGVRLGEKVLVKW
jgi:S-adenosylmethionine hydrolase